MQFGASANGFLDMEQRLVFCPRRTKRDTGSMSIASRPAVERLSVFRLRDLGDSERDFRKRMARQLRLEYGSVQFLAEVFVEVAHRDTLAKLPWISPFTLRFAKSELLVQRAIRRFVPGYPHLVLGLPVIGRDIRIADRPITNSRLEFVVEMKRCFHLEIIRHHTRHQSLPMPKRSADQTLVEAFELRQRIIRIGVMGVGRLIGWLRSSRSRRGAVVRRYLDLVGVGRILAFGS